MFVRDRFVPSEADVQAVICSHPLASMVSRDAQGFTANHFPLILNPKQGPHGTLIGHLTRQNPQHAGLRADPNVLAIFVGPSGYVSSSWYSNGRDMAPTWNYAAVHCHGRLTFAPDEKQTIHALTVLVEHMERNRPNAWSMEELGPGGLERRLPHIIGFEIAIERIEARFMMSQYERPADTAEAIEVLNRDGQHELADLMHRYNFAEK
ncbi:MAG TPA: FMN-binding negative transcriptional regulator [Candidatus Koribacter sp.]